MINDAIVTHRVGLDGRPHAGLSRRDHKPPYGLLLYQRFWDQQGTEDYTTTHMGEMCSLLRHMRVHICSPRHVEYQGLLHTL